MNLPTWETWAGIANINHHLLAHIRIGAGELPGRTSAQYPPVGVKAEGRWAKLYWAMLLTGTQENCF